MHRPFGSALRRYVHAGGIFAVAILALTASACAKKTPLQGAVITKVAGDVRVEQSSAAPRAIAESDLYTQAGLLTPGAQLIVGKNSRADLAFSTGLALSVTECSRLTLEAARIVLDKGYSRVEIKLQQGGVFSRSPRLDRNSSYRVATPTTIAAVRGTEFLVSQGGGCNFPDRPEAATLVSDGSVGVQSAGGGAEETLGAGQKAEVREGGVAVSEISADEKARLASLSSSLAALTEAGQARIDELLKDFAANAALYEEALLEADRGGPAPPASNPTPAPAPQSNTPSPAPGAAPAASTPQATPTPTPAPAPAPAPAAKPEENKVGEGADSAPML